VAPSDSTTIPSFQTVCCGGYATLAATAGGQVWVAWHASENPPGERGIFYQGVDPASGAPLGTRTRIPYASPFAPSQSVALAALHHPSGRVLAATTSSQGLIDLTDVATGARVPLAGAGRGNSRLRLAADPSGRIWVVWRTRAGDIGVIRSNVGATRWGAFVGVDLPTGARTLWGVSADAQAGVLDIVGQLSVSRGSGNPDTGLGAWHTQVRPGLTLTLVTAAVRPGFRAVFRVQDAGDPVAGARVRLGSRSVLTNVRGQASLLIPETAAPGRRVVRATKAGYTADSDTLTVRPLR